MDERIADGNFGLLISMSGVRLGLPGRFRAARGAGLRELGRLAEAVDEPLEHSFRAACPSVHVDGAYEKVLARPHGAGLGLLPRSGTSSVIREWRSAS